MSNPKLEKSLKTFRTWRIIFNTVQNAGKPHPAGSEDTAIMHFEINIFPIPQCRNTASPNVLLRDFRCNWWVFQWQVNSGELPPKIIAFACSCGYDKTKFNLVYFFYFSKMVPLHVYKCQTWILYSLVKENRKWYSKFNKGVQTPKTTIMEEKGRACVLWNLRYGGRAKSAVWPKNSTTASK